MENLINWRDECLKELELLLGPRNPWYSLGDVRFYEAIAPHPFLPDGSRTIEIRLSMNAKGNEDLTRWQLAHECAHLLDPLFSSIVNVLEEGIATWFQEKKIKGKNFLVEDKYIKAKALVLNFIEENALLEKVKQLRDEGLRIHEITAKDLLRVMPDMLPYEAKALTEDFDLRRAPVSLSGIVRL